MAKTKKVEGFHTSLLSINKRGVEARASYLFLILLLLVGYNSGKLVNNDNLVTLIGLSLVLIVVFLICFIAYDVLYGLVARKLPTNYNLDRLVLFGSELVLIGLIIPPVFVSWLNQNGSVLYSYLVMGELWVGLFAVVILIARVVGGSLWPQPAKARVVKKTTKKKR